MILAWVGPELSCRLTSDWHTEWQTQAMTIPRGQNWPRVKIIMHFISQFHLYGIKIVETLFNTVSDVYAWFHLQLQDNANCWEPIIQQCVKMFHYNSDEESNMAILEGLKWISLTCIIATVAFGMGIDIMDVKVPLGTSPPHINVVARGGPCGKRWPYCKHNTVSVSRHPQKR